MNMSELGTIANNLVANHRGILAADESTSTITKRFDTIGLESTEEHRRLYRELLFTAPRAGQYISGVILYDETLRQKTTDGVAFPAFLKQQGMIPGIKVDMGAKPLAAFPGETITEGLDGLRERLQGYYALGAKFAKWRAVIDIGSGMPSNYAIDANAEALARYASLCQEVGIVPIVEPEVLMDGAHTLERCEEVTSVVLHTVFSHLFEARVRLEGILLKPNMVVPGKKCPNQGTPELIASATLRTLKRQVPSAVPGIAFLSGGQSPTDATMHLNLMSAEGPLPWTLTFSYGRALQEDALRAWGGKPAGFAAGQTALALRAKLNSLAAAGTYRESMENPTV